MRWLRMTKSGIARIVILILFFFFMILYGMQLTGYNDYRTNRKKMLTSEELSSYEITYLNEEKENILLLTKLHVNNMPNALQTLSNDISSKIIEYRNQNGKFESIEDIKNVNGIGDNKYEKIKDLITVK